MRSPSFSIPAIKRGVVQVVPCPSGGYLLSEMLHRAGYAVKITRALSGPSCLLGTAQLAILLGTRSHRSIEEVYRACSAIRREVSNLPVIVLGPNDTDAKVRIFSIGADDYIVEPFDCRVFFARIDSVIRGYCHRPP